MTTRGHAGAGSGLAAGGARRRTQHGRGVEYGAAARPIVQKKPCARRSRTDPTWRRGESCGERSEEHTSELQSLMRKSYAVLCLKTKNNKKYRVQVQAIHITAY